eukprot:5856149-Prymnesium_polylepis.1
MVLMIKRGELTADEQRLAETDLEAKQMRATAGSKTAAEELLQILRTSKPIVRKPKRAAEIEALEERLASLAELESPKVPLPLAEVQKLNAKPKLLAELAELKAASRGWFDGTAE